MSFIGAEKQGQTYAPGWFLVTDEDCGRKTRQIAQNSALVERVSNLARIN